MPRVAKSSIRAWIVLMAGFVLVHVATLEGVAQGGKEKKASAAAAGATPAPNALPAQVAEMRDGIQAAIKSGRIEDLKAPIAWNELPPVFATEKVADPIAYWKQRSDDGEGREILAILANILDAGHATIPVGRDVENSRLYVWPRFAEMPLDKLSPEDEVQLYRMIPPSLVKTMREKKKWTWYRLTIGADGTWHSFQKAE